MVERIEIWKVHRNFKIYEISNLGNIRFKESKKLLKKSTNKKKDMKLLVLNILNLALFVKLYILW